MAHPRTGRVEAYSINYLKDEWTPVGNAVAADLAFLKKELPGEFSVTSRTLADDKWTVAVAASDAAPTTWLYDRKAKKLTKLFTSRPALEGQTLGRDAPGRDQVARRADPGVLSHPSAGQRSRRRRPALRGGADGAARPWRSVGPR